MARESEYSHVELNIDEAKAVTEVKYTSKSLLIYACKGHLRVIKRSKCYYCAGQVHGSELLDNDAQLLRWKAQGTYREARD